jgi:hypothetical protein
MVGVGWPMGRGKLGTAVVGEQKFSLPNSWLESTHLNTRISDWVVQSLLLMGFD